MDIFEILKYIVYRGIDLYMYCTDFVIYLSNLSGLSYYEINFLFFCVLYPVLLILGTLFFILQKLRYSSLRSKYSD